MRAAIVWMIASLVPVLSVAQTAPRTTLDIYVIDVEGGTSMLFVSPSGESLLIDSGNPASAAPRDAGRILDAAKAAGLERIDHLLTPTGITIISALWANWPPISRSGSTSIMAPTYNPVNSPIRF